LPRSSINARFPPVEVTTADGETVEMKPADWLAQMRPVEQMTWAPGEPQLIRDRLVTQGGWVDRRDTTVFNLYRPPMPMRGNADLVGPWVDHVCKVYPDDWPHIIMWLA